MKFLKLAYLIFYGVNLGPWGKSMDEKSEGQKTRDTLSLKSLRIHFNSSRLVKEYIVLIKTKHMFF
jgi:hypothetical protein